MSKSDGIRRCQIDMFIIVPWRRIWTSTYGGTFWDFLPVFSSWKPVISDVYIFNMNNNHYLKMSSVSCVILREAAYSYSYDNFIWHALLVGVDKTPWSSVEAPSSQVQGRSFLYEGSVFVVTFILFMDRLWQAFATKCSWCFINKSQFICFNVFVSGINPI